LKDGSENNQLLSDILASACPNCGAEETLEYSTKELDIDDKGDETVLVEGLICSECKDIFMSPDEGARFLNIKARHDGSKLYYGVHDGVISETNLH
jgi:hypothetical protein